MILLISLLSEEFLSMKDKIISLEARARRIGLCFSYPILRLQNTVDMPNPLSSSFS